MTPARLARSALDAVAVGMHRRGAMPEPDSREPWFISAAHDDGDVARIVEIFADSLDAALEARAGAPEVRGSAG